MRDELVEIVKARDRLLNAHQSSPLECTSIAVASLTHFAKTYRISRRLLPGYIDCSTLVSQAHWEGAAVQTPFIAENQRVAESASHVPNLAEALPGDVLIAYGSKDEAPGGRHNHVALVLANDASGEGWAIQATECSGTEIIRLAEARIGGGIRRFSQNPLIPYADGDWKELVRRVPKLGRLGVRMKNAMGEEHRHSGIDVYADRGTRLFAPIDGTITSSRKHASIVIHNEHLAMTAALSPVDAVPESIDGGTVSRGDHLGTLSASPSRYPCDFTVPMGGRPHLHWELWAAGPMGYPPSVTVRTSAGHSPESVYRAYSPVYAVKLGDVGSPLVSG